MVDPTPRITMTSNVKDGEKVRDGGDGGGEN